MASTLDVYLNNKLVGHLIQDDDGQMGFDYSKNWLKDPLAVPISHSLPLRETAFSRKECRGFFAGILPEENKRKIIAGNLGISAQNDYALLEQIGGECAGAVTFVPAGEPLPEKNYSYRSLNETELADILTALPRRPLMAGDEGVRLSLAGVQDKIAVHVNGDKIFIPLGGAPSTHILKPAIERFEGVVFNEAYCMKLATKVGLSTAKVEIRHVDGIDYLLVKRYDRKPVPVPPHLSVWRILINSYARRLHQEDFCQALSIPPEKKYQSEGGPSLKQCFELLRDVSSVPAVDLRYFLDGVIFNVLIGNNDAHGKNFSLLYQERETLLTGGEGIRLAPLYDLVSTVYYPDLTKKMAMKIGGEYVSDKLVPRHFEKLAEEAGLAKPMVVRRVPELAEEVLAGLAEIEIDHEVVCKLITLIKERCEFFINRFKA
ncbi:MAG: putative kinase Y4mE [Nitrospinaceae bacterium]|nr:MAG: putative kinase Y4mE [Nitrospinaceae bacterium]